MTEEPRSEAENSTKWATIKDRLAIGLVILCLVVFVSMSALDTVMNFRCSVWQFVTFECNRFDAAFKKWE